jgi:hypothetical protein
LPRSCLVRCSETARRTGGKDRMEDIPLVRIIHNENETDEQPDQGFHPLPAEAL